MAKLFGAIRWLGPNSQANYASALRGSRLWLHLILISIPAGTIGAWKQSAAQARLKLSQTKLSRLARDWVFFPQAGRKPAREPVDEARERVRLNAVTSG